MPIASDPNATCWLPLRIDEKLPADQRAEFQCRFLTIAQRREVMALLEESSNETDNLKSVAIIDRAISVGYVGWRRVKNAETNELVPCELGEGGRPRFELLDVALTVDEKIELAIKSAYGTTLSEREKKSSGSGPASATESSSAPAAAGDASAPTPAGSSASTT